MRGAIVGTTAVVLALEKRHRYRLDFSLLNAHTMRFVGVELSPHPTHGAVQDTSTKPQADVNREIAATFAREMLKRNEYFARFGITTLTFTDEQLIRPDECFVAVAVYLVERGQQTTALAQELCALEGLELADEPRPAWPARPSLDATERL